MNKKTDSTPRIPFLLVILTAFLGLPCWSDCPPVNGYITSLPTEPATVRQARHKRITERRADRIVIVHRGGYAFAPENTLEAYSACMDYGADGVEIDIRRSADGVLYILHDDCLNRVADDYGPVGDMTYYQLLSAELKKYGLATAETRIPTLAAVVQLARQRCMMLEFHVKDADIEDDIAAMLDAADAWDHVVNFSSNAEKLLANPRFKRVHVTAFLPEGRRDMDPELLRPFIPKPGMYVMVDDPRLIAQMIGRRPHRPDPMPGGLRMLWRPSTQTEASAPLGSPACVRDLDLNSYSPEQLLEVLREDLGARTDIDGAESYQQQRGERIWQRSWAAHRLGRLRSQSSQVICWLEYQVKNRSLHRDWNYNGLDGEAAIGALASLGSIESVPMLISVFKKTDPALAKIKPADDTQTPVSWYDAKIKDAIMTALGDLKCEASKQFLLEYLAMDDASASQLGYPMFDEAAASLLRQHLSRLEIESLLTYPKSDVRGLAVQYCLDHPSLEGDAALRARAPWALKLSRVRQ